MSTETATPAETAAEPKLSPVETHKIEGKFLRGTLAEEFADASLDHLSEANKSLIKFHGSYQQEDRDARKNRSKAGAGKAYMFMIRLKLPGGKLTADQYLAMDDLCGKYGNSTLRITTRQSFQFHGVMKPNMKPLLQGVNKTLLTTLGGCGDVNRNVLACPAPIGDAVHKQQMDDCLRVAAALTPKAGKQAYHEVWLDGEKLPNPELDEEPLYGPTYLPRKFKIAFAMPDDNCTDILANCLGYLIISENGKPIGYNLYAGGGQGQTNSKPDTYPLLAQPIGFIHFDEVVPAAEAMVKLFRDHGNRSDRKRARLKYVVHDMGVEKFRDLFYGDYFKHPRREPKHAPITGLDLHLGWNGMGDGKWFLGVSVENGRIKDEGGLRLRAGLREIVSRFKLDVRLTTQQDILLCGVATADKPAVEALLAEYGIPRESSLPMVQKWSMACPAIPTCSLAITESERSLPGVVRQLETVLTDLGLAGEPISVRMTGCPNGCARPYQSEIGLVGRGGTKYTVYIGGDSFGRRLNAEVQDSVPIEQIVPRLSKVFAAFKAERAGDELFGSYCERVGLDKVKSLFSA
ncbi:sulfite reductase : Sulfite reductase, beta subunit (Hemoprotein) OS=Singulisphaera acidiphila (strain ATCC BAA-1392 / DSM 18658 / VKM B-2454 / MOB10) GN=Sinac_4901 PE=4 SV=1: NIR_SIR_ferr: NIR_SIR: NIR_SIR_ferr: NIR_SIR [Gemmataceae bacterium]|nr:sulfite reductase : Sulfite reductase, beta subunit (Hemoprotein) OS=Singulisphaera acidiphila (strain ATCC BAA-1392 / DSM 18658 / VKM B-2454 / MOB10) GN=Sinac_4901 PE=4 SV=1: NIR_SIR_ferr: NIR_SIR: NIR_SIR_ferr: NIR_SIR [Gemmataceae bacterium]VTU01849.1 sulfite reductase : Sulfite reductase, beta subunit (Hemoprotein) OS=Singulisphaera acidiphila (strain ATCC BAA-1392 / DSM 18658 / VKM B-2454 / MOB10) GN=Sinac_4901 PE=4 SV=1: NIR_SIR_ferr: NIR_SIR: NIR_SIR_ferr: NIR_SIR [Gemmataceae bacterium]